MSRCRLCGSYNDYFEWNPEYREFYNPHICFSCYQEQLSQEDDDLETDEPEEIEDDAPDLQAADSATENDNLETEETTDDTESEPLPDDTRSIENIKRMLFG